MINFKPGDSGFLVEFTDNKLYLQNGEMSFPLNALSLVIDKSNTATFKRTATNDVVFSAPISTIKFDGTQATKANIESLFAETCTGAIGGASDAIPVSVTTTGTSLSFYNEDGDLLFSADTSAYVADKYVKQAYTSGTTLYLVIDTETGDTEVSVDMNGILIDYYTKQELDNMEQAIAAALTELDTRMDNMEEEAEDFALESDLNILEAEYSGFTASTTTALNAKLDSSAYTPVTIDSALNSGSTNPVQNAVVTTALNAKANVVELTQSEYDALSPNYDPNTIYIISDASPVNMSNYLPVSAYTVDLALNSGSTNPVANSAVTASLNAKLDASAYVIDNALNSGSTNPVQNAVITTAIGDINTILNNINGNS